MSKRVVKILDLPSSGVSGVLLILAAAFFLGGLAGCLFANQADGSGGDALRTYLEEYLAVACSEETLRPDISSLLWEILRWPVLLLFFALTPLGLLGIPILFLVRGFLLSFAIASFFRVLGGTGLALAVVVFGVTGLICIPALFVWGIQSFLSAGAMAGRLMGGGKRLPLVNRLTLLRYGICAALLFGCALLEYSVIPAWLRSLAVILLN